MGKISDEALGRYLGFAIEATKAGYGNERDTGIRYEELANALAELQVHRLRQRRAEEAAYENAVRMGIKYLQPASPADVDATEGVSQ